MAYTLPRFRIYDSPRQGKRDYRVAQQLERQRELEEPVRARPLFPT
jgi:hypothetical protein